jgi:hypothetical protein
MDALILMVHIFDAFAKLISGLCVVALPVGSIDVRLCEMGSSCRVRHLV